MLSALSPTAVPSLIYGLFVPLVGRGTFEARVPADAKALRRAIESTGAHTLVASPARVRELLALCAEERLGELVQCIPTDEGFDARTSRRLQEDLGVRVLEPEALPLDEAGLAFHAPLLDALLDHPRVHDAGLAFVPASGEQAARHLVAVAAPADCEAELRARVEAHVPAGEALELRTFERLPRDDNGRLQAWRAGLLFGYGRAGRRLVLGLEWTAVAPAEAEDAGQRANGAAGRFRTRLPEDYGFFEGHYTAYPVLAGAAQITELVLPCLRRLEPGLSSPRRLSGLKFISRIAPGDELDVVLRRGASPGDFRFEILSGERRCSVGRLEFETVPDPEDESTQ